MALARRHRGRSVDLLPPVAGRRAGITWISDGFYLLGRRRDSDQVRFAVAGADCCSCRRPRVGPARGPPAGAGNSIEAPLATPPQMCHLCASHFLLWRPGDSPRRRLIYLGGVRARVTGYWLTRRVVDVVWQRRRRRQKGR